MCDFTNYKKLNRFYDNKINFIKETDDLYTTIRMGNNNEKRK